MTSQQTDPLDFDWQSILDVYAKKALPYVEILSTPWALVQIGVVIVCYLFAHLLARFISPPLEARLRRIESQPQLMRVLVVPLRRLKWILFALLLWLAVATMREITWPSRSYYVGVAATLAAAGVVISIISRFIRNRSFANFFAALAWSVAALSLVGLLDETLVALDLAAISIGTFRLSLLIVLKGALFLAMLIWLATLLGNFVERRVHLAADVSPALQVLISKFVKFGLLTVAVLATLSAIGLDLTAFAVFSGAVGIGIGFGIQKVASNLISGMIILMDRSIKPGDVIELGSTFGWINSLKARYVSVITREGVEYIIPNETFVSERVVNWSHSDRRIRLEIKFGVSYGSDPHQVREMAVAAIQELGRVLATPLPVCHVVAFGDSSLDFVLRFWIDDPENGLTNIRGAAFLALWDTFKEHGVQIPYPHRQVLLPTPVTVESRETN